jgi:spermidine dehydrogenase
VAYLLSITGLRGSHPGFNTHAHAHAWNTNFSAGDAVDAQKPYGLVVVGAGLSGLATAFFYRQKFGPEKKILIPDNQDDFGSHAKRNEHIIDNRPLIT